MTIEIKVPQLPESVTDATLVTWHHRVGEHVERDENLVDLETDKVVLEVPAPAAGILEEIRVEDGATVVAGDVIAILTEADARAGVQISPAVRDEPSGVLESAAEQKAAKTSPAVRRLLEEHDLDVSMLEGTGKDGRITKADVMTFLKSPETAEVTPADVASDAAAEEVVAIERRDRRVPMTRLRARIAQRLVEAQRTAAMLTTFNEVDLSEVMALRNRHRETFENQFGVRLGFMSFFAKAAVEALKKYPVVNASVEGDEIVYHDYFDIGIAGLYRARSHGAGAARCRRNELC